jgi:hypothetical protein
MRPLATSSQLSDVSGLASTLQLLVSLLLSGQEKGISRLSANKHHTQNACNNFYSKIKIKFKENITYHLSVIFCVSSTVKKSGRSKWANFPWCCFDPKRRS